MSKFVAVFSLGDFNETDIIPRFSKNFDNIGKSIQLGDFMKEIKFISISGKAEHCEIYHPDGFLSRCNDGKIDFSENYACYVNVSGN